MALVNGKQLKTYAHRKFIGKTSFNAHLLLLWPLVIVKNDEKKKPKLERKSWWNSFYTRRLFDPSKTKGD